MTPSALTHPDRLRGLPTRIHGRPAAKTRHPIGPAEAAARQGSPSDGVPVVATQVVLMANLISPEGRTWWAVGLGDTLAAAIAFARDSCPTDTTRQPVRWNDVYGD